MAETNHSGAPREPERTPRKKKRRDSGGAAIALGVGKVLGTLILVGITTCAILACFAAVYIKTVILPQSYVDASTFKMDLSSTIYYNDPDTGEAKELLTLHGDENRVLVDYENIPEDLVHAAVAVEDKRFYEHNGVDWYRTAGAFVNMFLGMRNNFGGSTLTQQLIKNMTEKDEVTVQRKILEIFRALEFERNNSKEDILEMYLNYIFLGEGCYGVGTAAYTYFGKDVSQLSLAECASLIGITNNPSAYDPYISENTRNNNKERQELILDLMKEQGYITAEERDAAKAEPLVFQRGEDESHPATIYSYYEDEIIRDVIEDLKRELDLSDPVASQMVYSGGLSIYSCYDPHAQSVVDSVYGSVENLPANSNSKSGQQLQSAITVIDNETGNVVALAGGVGPKEGSLTQNRAVKTIRPPGSSIKPLAVYAPALEMGMITPGTVIDDSPYQILNGDPWPINSFGYYRGLTTVYEGLEDSVNTVAVKVMAEYTTPDIAYEFLTTKLGISTDHVVRAKEVNGKVYSDVDIAPLALGGLTNGVSTLEMAAAYSTFPRGGVYIEPRTYTKVVANDGVTVLLDNQPETHVAMKDTTAYQITYMLDNAAHNGTGTNAVFSGMHMAGKTGTTTSRKDLWFAGYTPYYTAVVWTGYDQQERIPTGSGLTNPSTGLWKAVMSQLHEGLEDKSFATPESASTVDLNICRDSGLLLTDACKHDARGNRAKPIRFIKGTEPVLYCDKHVDVEICLDAPFLNDKGEKTGMFHLAGPNCPEESRRVVGIVDVLRDEANNSAPIRDSMFTKAYLDGLGEAAYCDVHTEAQPVETPPTLPGEPGFPEGPDAGGGETTDPGASNDPNGSGHKPIDPKDPSTWPPDPSFNPYDETTWPDWALEDTDTPGNDPFVPAGG